MFLDNEWGWKPESTEKVSLVKKKNTCIQIKCAKRQPLLLTKVSFDVSYSSTVFTVVPLDQAFDRVAQ